MGCGGLVAGRAAAVACTQRCAGFAGPALRCAARVASTGRALPAGAGSVLPAAGLLSSAVRVASTGRALSAGAGSVLPAAGLLSSAAGGCDGSARTVSLCLPAARSLCGPGSRVAAGGGAGAGAALAVVSVEHRGRRPVPGAELRRQRAVGLHVFQSARPRTPGRLAVQRRRGLSPGSRLAFGDRPEVGQQHNPFGHLLGLAAMVGRQHDLLRPLLPERSGLLAALAAIDAPGQRRLRQLAGLYLRQQHRERGIQRPLPPEFLQSLLGSRLAVRRPLRVLRRPLHSDRHQRSVQCHGAARLPHDQQSGRRKPGCSSCTAGPVSSGRPA